MVENTADFSVSKFFNKDKILPWSGNKTACVRVKPWILRLPFKAYEAKFNLKILMSFSKKNI